MLCDCGVMPMWLVFGDRWNCVIIVKTRAIAQLVGRRYLRRLVNKRELPRSRGDLCAFLLFVNLAIDKRYSNSLFSITVLMTNLTSVPAQLIKWKYKIFIFAFISKQNKQHATTPTHSAAKKLDIFKISNFFAQLYMTSLQLGMSQTLCCSDPCVRTNNCRRLQYCTAKFVYFVCLSSVTLVYCNKTTEGRIAYVVFTKT